MAMATHSHIVRQEPSPDDALRAAVTAELRRLWIRPAMAPRRFDVPRGQVDNLAKAALDTMLVRSYRVTPLPPPDEYAQLLSRVRYWVRRGRPIQIMLGYGPMKNPHSTGHAHADWAEFFAFCHLCAWHNKISAIYPPGLRIKIIFDDSTIRMANRHARQPMEDYMRSVGRLMRDLNYESFMDGTMRQSSFAWLFHLGLYQLARWRVRRWERDPANLETLDRMLEYSRRNLVVPDHLTGAERERYHRDAAHRYRVYWEALQLSGLSRSGNKIVAMYLDGNQHHIRQDAALHLTSLGKGQVTQPWQGEGALRDNGHGKLVPTVLTTKRREEFHARRIEVRDIVPHDGLDSIFVCYDQAAPRVIPAEGDISIPEEIPTSVPLVYPSPPLLTKSPKTIAS
jgi:hypothetical protein